MIVYYIMPYANIFDDYKVRREQHFKNEYMRIQVRFAMQSPNIGIRGGKIS